MLDSPKTPARRPEASSQTHRNEFPAGGIPWQVALQQSLPPLSPPTIILRQSRFVRRAILSGPFVSNFAAVSKRTAVQIRDRNRPSIHHACPPKAHVKRYSLFAGTMLHRSRVADSMGLFLLHARWSLCQIRLASGAGGLASEGRSNQLLESAAPIPCGGSKVSDPACPGPRAGEAPAMCEPFRKTPAAAARCSTAAALC